MLPQICWSDLIKIYQLYHSASFIVCVSLWLVNEKMRYCIIEEVLMNCNGLYLLCHITTKSMCTWLHYPLKFIASVMFCYVRTNLCQPGWFLLRFICVFLGCDLPKKLLLKWSSRRKSSTYIILTMYQFTSGTTVVWKVFVWNYFIVRNIREKNFRGFPVPTKIF